MTTVDTTSVLVQYIALFLPAWAILVQLLYKIIKGVDTKSTLYYLPVISLSIALAIYSLYVIVLATLRNIVVHIGQLNNTTQQIALASSYNDIGSASVALGLLGILILISTIISHFPFPENIHTVLLSIIMIAVMWEFGFSNRLGFNSLFSLLFLNYLFLYLFWDEVEHKAEYLQAKI
jgi:hypothetical protein